MFNIHTYRNMVVLLIERKGKWFFFSEYLEETVRSLVNDGIAEVKGNQIKLKSKKKADYFLASW